MLQIPIITYWQHIQRLCKDLTSGSWLLRRNCPLWKTGRQEDGCLILETEVSADKRVIGCCWIFANEYDAEGRIVWQKVRLVAKRYSQVLDKDYDETYVAVVWLESLRITIAVTAMLGLEIWQVDFVSAYLNSISDFQIYMDILPDLSGEEKKKVVLLKMLWKRKIGFGLWTRCTKI